MRQQQQDQEKEGGEKWLNENQLIDEKELQEPIFLYMVRKMSLGT